MAFYAGSGNAPAFRTRRLDRPFDTALLFVQSVPARGCGGSLAAPRALPLAPAPSGEEARPRITRRFWPRAHNPSDQTHADSCTRMSFSRCRDRPDQLPNTCWKRRCTGSSETSPRSRCPEHGAALVGGCLPRQFRFASDMPESQCSGEQADAMRAGRWADSLTRWSVSTGGRDEGSWARLERRWLPAA